MSVRVTVKSSGSIQDDIVQDIQKRLLDLHSMLVQKSPVDTGSFRAAWTVDTATLSVENNNEYAEALAHGHSPQAPDGWIDESITAVFPK